MPTNPTATTTTVSLRARARAWQGIALGCIAVALQRTVAGAGIRQKYKAHRDRLIRAALRRDVPIHRLAEQLRLAPATIRAINRGERTAE
ncbi:hypothetical protein ACIG0C_34940 [Kitasatospora aureofaciens]|uniref:Resolvase HTH domain-containing protein n=1 Tax=Kitasatospora aureofaciens TaxID=1894 RepID=A0A1E7NEC8_KITAU|nr:hypothetical protein [Kitasatospora aureofaciens]ARF83255.1 hypothetical protein B6264_30415 [Kitasatospora aureofaciens]OEV39024.1 hypothetical protein HS99_0018145 [Kitasatospora aureofaciens]GGV03565.1 hypothetical protein GCM10010502_67750 [Kitasatospora aureofaciens]